MGSEVDEMPCGIAHPATVYCTVCRWEHKIDPASYLARELEKCRNERDALAAGMADAERDAGIAEMAALESHNRINEFGAELVVLRERMRAAEKVITALQFYVSVPEGSDGGCAESNMYTALEAYERLVGLVFTAEPPAQPDAPSGPGSPK